MFSLCANIGANTGEILCDVSRGILKKSFIYNDVFGSSQYADSDTFLAALVNASKKSKYASDKLFPLPEVQDIADKSEANKEGTLGLGFKTVLLEGKPAYEIKGFAGNALLKQLRKFNNQTIRIFEFDSNNNFWGTKSGTDFMGFKAKVFFTGGKIATGQNVEEGIVTCTIAFLDTTEYFDNAYYMPITGNITSVVGLKDVELYEAAANASNAFKIGGRIATSQIGNYINLQEKYGAELADDALWVATVVATGAALTITSVANDTTNKRWTVTFDATEFGALAGGAKIKLNLAAPEVLDANDVSGIEGIEFTIDK